PEKLLLRVQGRTPGDDPATYQVKFGGSFIASTDADSESAPTVAVVPEKKVETVTEVEKETIEKAESVSKNGTKPESKPKVEVAKVKSPTLEKIVAEKKESAKAQPKPTTPKPAVVKKPTTVRPPKPEVAEKPAPDPLAKYSLVIVFKDGKKLDKPMTEVERVTVEGVNLVVILKSGVITTYSLLTVEKFTID
ncbi:MAG TPA: hypothetical protein PKA82_11345, partial [Pyrinomonadaceae bacterium]|nr:hypothetical protein [Pyrinomonadaceae bacterium]